jgi:predicted AlkP superfamily pyrophosphatase or phosphodiesterase
MKRLSKHLFVISFDGLSTLDFDYIASLPNFKQFIEKASYCKKVYSVYPSLTYPAHTSIVTGKYPKNHGIINNTLLQPNRKSPDWYWYRKDVKGETLYDLAIERGMKVASLLWPVTARSKIQYNMPEIFANRPCQNQILVSLLNGSPLFQIWLNSKFGQLRNGIKQPNLDNFTHQSLLYTIKNKKIDLYLVHYTDLDAMRHLYGFNSNEAKMALQRHDKRLGEIIKTQKECGIYDESTVVVLGDHSSLDEDKIINLNLLFKQKGYIDVDNSGRITNYKAIAKNCDGSSYIYTKEKNNQKLINEIYNTINDFNNEYKCIEAIYTSKQASDMGADPQCAFMLEANKGYYFSDDIEGEVIKSITPENVGHEHRGTKSTHGYSPFKKDYTTVFMIGGKGVRKGEVISSMSLIDEGPTLAKLLGLKFKDADGKIIEQFFNNGDITREKG